MFAIIKRAIAPLAITLATASTPVFAAGSPLGVWIDHTGRGAVEITDCNGKLCGRLVWFKDTKNGIVRVNKHVADSIGMTVDEIGWFAAGFHLDPQRSTAGYQARYAELTRSFELPEKRKIKALSKGMRAKVSLAVALASDPPILILDEPTSDLDPNEKSEVIRYIKEIGKERTILLSTHNLTEVEAACARAIIVSKGRVVADGPLDEIRAKSGRVRYVVSVQESAGSHPYRGQGQPPKKSEVEHSLNQLTGIKKVTELPTDERAHTYELTTDRDVDLRPDLFQLIVQKGWVLLELHRDAQTLEDVFRHLTIGDARRNKTLDSSEDDEDEETDDETEEESDSEDETEEEDSDAKDKD
jgi:ABC-type multidrug transport system ATPase subunit